MSCPIFLNLMSYSISFEGRSARQVTPALIFLILSVLHAVILYDHEVQELLSSDKTNDISIFKPIPYFNVLLQCLRNIIMQC